jgi:hypothetical protein
MKNSNRNGAEGKKGIEYGIFSLRSPSFFDFFALVVL